MSANQGAQVLIIGYNRPDLIRKRLIEIRDSRISRLHVSIDGSTPENNQKHEQILREFKQSHSGEMNFSYRIHSSNLGLTVHVTSAISDFLVTSENAIILEDDISINKSTVESFIAGLSELKKMNRLGTVGSFSPIRLPKVIEKQNRFIVSRYFLCWGWAVTRETWHEYNSTLKLDNLVPELAKSKTWKKLNSRQKNVWMQRFNKVSQSPGFTWDFQMQFASFRKDMIHLIPLGGLSMNEGFSDHRATHTRNSKPKWMVNMTPAVLPVKKLNNFKLLNWIANSVLAQTVVGDNQFILRNSAKFLMRLKRITLRNF